MDNTTEPLPGGVWRIEPTLLTNVYLVARNGEDDRDGLLLIDTGTPSSGPRLVRSIRMLGFDPRRVGDVLLTSWRRRHAGSAARLAASSARPVVRAAPEGVPQPGTGPRRPYAAAPATPIEPLRPGAGPAPGMVVLPAPGPAPGHLAFWFPDSGLLIAGDALTTLPTLWTGPRAVHDRPDLLPSTLAAMARHEPSVVACGHGRPVRRDAASRLTRVAAHAAGHLS